MKGEPRALTHPASVDPYERWVSIPAARAGMTETDWIAHRALSAAYRDAARAQAREDAA